MTRYLGIDYGTKRIGLAIGDDVAKLASPITTLAAKGQFPDHAQTVWTAAGEYSIDAFVIGLPLNMDNTEGKQAKLTRQFGSKLSSLSGKPIHYFDERLSTIEARELLQPAGLTRKKRKAVQDAVAAAVLLQEFLEAQDAS